MAENETTPPSYINHMQEARRLLANGGSLAEAQVHATLALSDTLHFITDRLVEAASR